MNYRIYVDGSAGYYKLGTYSNEQALVCLDWLILCEKTKEKILVIEHNIKDNIDFPVFIYLGKVNQYEEFKRYLTSDETRVTKSYKRGE